LSPGSGQNLGEFRQRRFFLVAHRFAAKAKEAAFAGGFRYFLRDMAEPGFEGDRVGGGPWRL
jgi:hypothetical protein